MGFIKVIISGAVGYFLVGLADMLLWNMGIGLGPLTINAIYFAVALAIIYLPAKKRPMFGGSGGRTEYVLDGKGQSTGRVFDPAQYRGYTLLDSDADGRSFVDSNGKLLCTVYVGSGSSGGSSRIHLILLCLLAVLLGNCLEDMFRIPVLMDYGILLEHLRSRLLRLDPSPMLGHAWENLQGVGRSLLRIEPELDLAGCIRIILNNLEELSILKIK